MVPLADLALNLEKKPPMIVYYPPATNCFMNIILLSSQGSPRRRVGMEVGGWWCFYPVSIGPVSYFYREW